VGSPPICQLCTQEESRKRSPVSTRCPDSETERQAEATRRSDPYAEFDEVAVELARSLDFFKVPEREKEEVLAAFAAYKGEVTEGYSQVPQGAGQLGAQAAAGL
jgi:hypothetical protein